MRRGLRGRRGWIVAALGLCAAVLGVCASMLVNGPPSWYDADTVDGCNLGPTLPELRTSGHTGFTWPYGAVTGCREFAHRGDWLNRGKSIEWLFIDTQRGAVLIRLEVGDHGQRFWRAAGFETELDGAPDGLSSDEVQRLGADVAARGGVRTEPWIFNYGDG